MTRDELHELPLLSSFFPLVFRSGARWERFHGRCGKCDAELPDGSLRGSVTHPFDPVYVVEAMGLCPSCDTLTPFSYRLHEDMSMTGPSPRDGGWSRWEAPRSAWRRLLSALLGRD